MIQVMEDSKDFIVKDFDFYHQDDEDVDGDQNEEDFMVGFFPREAAKKLKVLSLLVRPLRPSPPLAVGFSYR